MSLFDIQKLNAWFAEICTKANMVFWIRDLSYQKQCYVSPNYETLWGRSTVELYEHPDSWDKTIIVEDKSSISKPLEMRKFHYSNVIHFRIFKPNGEQICICDKSFELKELSGKSVAIAGIGQSLSLEEWIASQKFPIDTHSLVISLEEIIKKSLGLLLPQYIVPVQEHYRVTHAGKVYSLSLREAQCLCYSSIGFSAKEMARKMNLSPRTAETYLEHLRQKTNSRNKLQLLGQIDMKDLTILREQLL
jgi:DNA-binding CsgD family transcriptional regulator